LLHLSTQEASAHELIDSSLSLKRRELNAAYEATSNAASQRESDASDLTSKCNDACDAAKRRAEEILARIERTLLLRGKHVPEPEDDTVMQLASQRR
jgi:hypothetical protein